MIDWFKKHRVLFALICVVILLLLMGVPFVINILFKINATTDILVAEWSAGDALGYYGAILSFLGTVVLGALALYQNHIIKTEADKKAALAEEQERAENMPRFFLRFQCASGFCGSLKFAVMNVSNNIAYTIDVYDIKIKGGSKTIWESDDTYGAPVINPQKEMTIQTKSPATNETGEFTLFATMSCMDKYDGKHEYILKMTCRYPMLYSLLVSKGIIKDQRIVRGDLDDAVCTSSNTSLFYFIVETWDFGNHDGFRWGMPQEESFRLLSRRKNIYITTMDRAQYEKAQEFDYFKAFFPHTVEIRDLEKEEKVELLKCAAKEYGFGFDAKSFRNSDILKLPYPTLQTQLYSVIQNQLADADNTEFIMHASDFDPLAKKSDKNSNALEELDALIGLDSVKKCVREIVALLKNRGRSALPCLHMVFRGNPGTGKTTVARLVGKLFGEIGVIKDGEKFIETDRDGLVSQYLGGTAAKTASVVKDAIGGVLFIDEAYALASNASYDYGHEAINTLVKRLEDSRKDFVCIMAGYTNEMNQMLSSNPGLRDRIQFYIDFPDYSAEELVQIYCKYAESEAYQLGTDAKVTLRQMAEQIIRNKDENFSNARLIRKVFERTRMKQAMRTSDNMISAEDIQAVFAESDMRALLDSVQVQRRIGFVG